MSSVKQDTVKLDKGLPLDGDANERSPSVAM